MIFVRYPKLGPFSKKGEKSMSLTLSHIKDLAAGELDADDTPESEVPLYLTEGQTVKTLEAADAQARAVRSLLRLTDSCRNSHTTHTPLTRILLVFRSLLLALSIPATQGEANSCLLGLVTYFVLIASTSAARG